VSFTVEVIEIRSGPIDLSVFAIPSGYARVDAPVGLVGSRIQ
jgi:hypothetical protein